MPARYWTAALSFCAILPASGCIAQRGKPSVPPQKNIVALEVQPETVLVDQQASIVATGLGAGQVATVTATRRIDSVRSLVSRAVFRASDNGVIDVARDAPDSGTYAGIDGMGLIWSLAPEDHPARQQSPERNAQPPGVTEFELAIDGQTRATARLMQLSVAPGTRRVAVRDFGLVGTLFIPPGSGRRPIVIVLGGSEGGLESAEARAEPLTAHGYAALALAYFRMETLPRELVRIPLEYFERALAWIPTQPELDSTRVAIIGASRGAEAALLVATRMTMIRAVVAYGPSSLVWGGLDRTNPGAHVPAWTAGGVGLESGTSRAILDVPDSVARYAIPVERMHAPVLLIAGEDDRVWPSPKMAHQVIERLRFAGHSTASAELIFPDAGHAIAFPFIPVAPRLSIGGTAAGTARADWESWLAVLTFLDQALKRE
jgi:dienelactone hydrolase